MRSTRRRRPSWAARARPGAVDERVRPWCKVHARETPDQVGVGEGSLRILNNDYMYDNWTFLDFMSRGPRSDVFGRRRAACYL